MPSAYVVATVQHGPPSMEKATTECCVRARANRAARARASVQCVRTAVAVEMQTTKQLAHVRPAGRPAGFTVMVWCGGRRSAAGTLEHDDDEDSRSRRIVGGRRSMRHGWDHGRRTAEGDTESWSWMPAELLPSTTHTGTHSCYASRLPAAITRCASFDRSICVCPRLLRRPIRVPLFPGNK